MKHIKFFYSMKIDFSSPVIRHCFSLRCLPFDTPSQRIELINVDIEPHNMLTETADGFGNRVLTDRIIEPHSKFVAIVEGKASLDFSKREKEELNCIYKYPSQHTVPGEKIIELVSGLGDMANLTALETAQAVSKRIGEVFSYKSGCSGKICCGHTKRNRRNARLGRVLRRRHMGRN